MWSVDNTFAFFFPDDRQQLTKDCDALLKCSLTREDLIQEAECEVGTTTPQSTPKKRKTTESCPKKVPRKKCKPTGLDKSKAALKSKLDQQARVQAAKERARQMFSLSRCDESESESEFESESEVGTEDDIHHQLEEQRKLIQEQKEVIRKLKSAGMYSIAEYISSAHGQ